VRLVKVQETSVVMLGTKEKVPFSTRTMRTLVVQVPRRLNQLALGFGLGSELVVFIIKPALENSDLKEFGLQCETKFCAI